MCIAIYARIIIISVISCVHPLQVFFVIRLHSAQAAANLPPIHDPDPVISCDLMDGRDALLTLARDKHYEFSSLRRAKFSSIALLYELHNQGKESFVYNCNKCDSQVETRWHCTVCDVSNAGFDIYLDMSRDTMIATRYDSKPPAQLQKIASVLKFCIQKIDDKLSRQQTTKVLIRLLRCAG